LANYHFIIVQFVSWKSIKNIYFTILQNVLYKLLKLFVVIIPQLKGEFKNNSVANIIKNEHNKN